MFCTVKWGPRQWVTPCRKEMFTLKHLPKTLASVRTYNRSLHLDFVSLYSKWKRRENMLHFDALPSFPRLQIKTASCKRAWRWWSRRCSRPWGRLRCCARWKPSGPRWWPPSARWGQPFLLGPMMGMSFSSRFVLVSRLSPVTSANQNPLTRWDLFSVLLWDWNAFQKAGIIPIFFTSRFVWCVVCSWLQQRPTAFQS